MQWRTPDSINNVSRVIGEIAFSSEEQSRGIQQTRMVVNEVVSTDVKMTHMPM
ncbi:hypothetical protein HCP56_001410 [Salmonella enterica subsp. diarizonae]|nr:hypothetical protein [Salmonella enterica subsp. diarizonae]